MAGLLGGHPTGPPPPLTRLPLPLPRPLTVSQLGDTRPGRNAEQSCFCLLTERRRERWREQRAGRVCPLLTGSSSGREVALCPSRQ